MKLIITLDNIRTAITTDKVMETARTIDCRPYELYNIRTNFNRFLGKINGYVTPQYIPFFEQLKAEGITEVTKTPMTEYGSRGGKSSSYNISNSRTEEETSLDPNHRDPIAEIEIAFDTFKNKLNELIPLIVEEQVKEAIFKASLGSKRKVRILR